MMRMLRIGIVSKPEVRSDFRPHGREWIIEAALKSMPNTAHPKLFDIEKDLCISEYKL
jgi:hypothetical protein